MKANKNNNNNHHHNTDVFVSNNTKNNDCDKNNESKKTLRWNGWGWTDQPPKKIPPYGNADDTDDEQNQENNYHGSGMSIKDYFERYCTDHMHLFCYDAKERIECLEGCYIREPCFQGREWVRGRHKVLCNDEQVNLNIHHCAENGITYGITWNVALKLFDNGVSNPLL